MTAYQPARAAHASTRGIALALDISSIPRRPARIGTAPLPSPTDQKDQTMKTDHIAKAARDQRDEQLDAIRKAHSQPYRLGLDGTKTRTMKPTPPVATSAKVAASTPLAKIKPARLGDKLKAAVAGRKS